MRSYATLAREIQAYTVLPSDNTSDMYKSSRSEIDKLRDRLAKDLWLSDLRLQMEVARWAE
jgi:hypothetical protein